MASAREGLVGCLGLRNGSNALGCPNNARPGSNYCIDCWGRMMIRSEMHAVDPQRPLWLCLIAVMIVVAVMLGVGYTYQFVPHPVCQCPPTQKGSP